MGSTAEALFQRSVDPSPRWEGAPADSHKIPRSPAKSLHRCPGDHHDERVPGWAYPPEVWDKIESKAKDLSQVQPEHRDFMRYYISCAEECEFDNQGRVLIPPLLRDRAKLGGPGGAPGPECSPVSRFGTRRPGKNRFPGMTNNTTRSWKK